MGQKVNPHGLRVGIIKDWDTKWYAEKDFADYLVEDVKIRKFIKKKLYAAGVSKIAIERTAGRVKISVYTAKPCNIPSCNETGNGQNNEIRCKRYQNSSKRSSGRR